MFTLLVDHANRSLSQLRGILCLSVHGSIFSKVGASAKPGAIQYRFGVGLADSVENRSNFHKQNQRAMSAKAQRAIKCATRRWWWEQARKPLP